MPKKRRPGTYSLNLILKEGFSSMGRKEWLPLSRTATFWSTMSSYWNWPRTHTLGSASRAAQAAASRVMSKRGRYSSDSSCSSLRAGPLGGPLPRLGGAWLQASAASSPTSAARTRQRGGEERVVGGRGGIVGLYPGV